MLAVAFIFRGSLPTCRFLIAQSKVIMAIWSIIDTRQRRRAAITGLSRAFPKPKSFFGSARRRRAGWHVRLPPRNVKWGYPASFPRRFHRISRARTRRRSLSSSSLSALSFSSRTGCELIARDMKSFLVPIPGHPQTFGSLVW